MIRNDNAGDVGSDLHVSQLVTKAKWDCLLQAPPPPSKTQSPVAGL